MTVEAANAEKLVAAQTQVIENFFGAEVPIPTPPDRLFQVAERIKEKGLFKAEPFYLPRRALSTDLQIPGLKVPPADWFYRQIRGGRVAKGADILPGQWVIFDVSRRPDYKDGQQMYPDSDGLGEILADLRNQGKIKIEVLDYPRKVPSNSRFAVSADEIDGKGGFVAKAVASILNLQSGEQVTTPSYAVFNYIGNLAYPEFGQANTWEWFADNFERGRRLHGGRSDDGGLADAFSWLSSDHCVTVGFRLQVSFPSKA